ncbi:hypothetical protein HanXRQr2_Chr17g0823311 [Helianthus annuus]|uniref:Uncharacterized protein n=1 Tax=Helianthus annuus TaxID=4232 RepID=A0A9K3DN52_HELAN|nr:hypothetical protein HanXRQr2_Chr17g0823311 [Helianthus annuus]
MGINHFLILYKTVIWSLSVKRIFSILKDHPISMEKLELFSGSTLNPLKEKSQLMLG